MNDEQTSIPQTSSPQQRLRELLSIPDNQKTEAQWDELIELEIAMAQGGRPIGGGPRPQGASSQQKKHGNNGKPQGQGQGQGQGGQPKKPQRKFHKKPPKPATAQ